MKKGVKTAQITLIFVGNTDITLKNTVMVPSDHNSENGEMEEID